MASAEPSLSRGPRDVAEQFTAIAERAVRMTGSNGAAIALRQNVSVITVASYGECVPDVGVSVRPTSFAGRSIAEETLLTCNDTEADPRVDAAACRALNVRSMIAAPIAAEGRTVGVLAVFASRPNAFPENKAGLVRTLAVIAGELIAFRERPVAARTEIQTRNPETVVVAPESKDPEPERTDAYAAPVSILPVPDDAGPTSVSADPVQAQQAPVPEETPTVASPPAICEEPATPDLPDSAAPEVDRPMLFLTLDQEERKTGTGMKLALVLLLIAVLATGQWMFRGRIIKAIRSRFAPRSISVAPSPAPLVPAQPVGFQPTPAAVQPADAQKSMSGTGQAADKPAAQAVKGGQEMAQPVPYDVRDHHSPTSTGKTADKPATPSGRSGSAAAPVEVKPPQLLSRVEPVYSNGLKAESTVVLNAMVLKDGTIGKITVVSGDAVLRQSAITAVKQWKYRPAYQNGQPVVATVPIEVVFKAR